MIVIQKGIPMPRPMFVAGPGRPSLYPWDAMEVGDSFLMPDKKSQTARNLAARAGKKRGWKFLIRKVDGGCRVWRVA